MWLQDALRSPPSRAPDSQAPVVLIRQLPPPAAATEPPPSRPGHRACRRALPHGRPPPRRRSRQRRPSPKARRLRRPRVGPGVGGGTTVAGQRSRECAARRPPLFDTAASRQAIREAARRPSAREQGAIATGEDAPLGAQERLGQEIARGARGDCLKGEYAGSGMGLLSLPFWLIAELNEKCRR